MSQPLTLAVLISGGGSNLQAIIDAIEAGWVNAEIKAVISNNPNAHGLVRAGKHGITSHVIDHRDFDSRAAFDARLQVCLQGIDPDFILLAGFMRILGAEIIQTFAQQIINIHPSLLPAYKGLNTYQRALDGNESRHGVSIHLVTAELDDGPVLLQGSYPIEAGDSAQDLQKKGLQLEHRMYPQLLCYLSETRLCIKGGQVFYDQALLEKPIQFNL